MASYVIAGRADDPSFARAEYAAKQIEAACPNVFFRYEMKHPDAWKDFICSVFRQYDFHGYPEDFGGPLVWTHEGELVGGGADFIQKVCIKKFGIPDPPTLSDPLFKQIAADNLKQVRVQLHREQNGPPFGEKCEAACNHALAAGFVEPARFDERRRVVSCGASLEVWVSSNLESEWASLREAHGDGQPVRIEPGLKVCALGQDLSHLAVLHPRPISKKQLVLVPQRHAREVSEASAPAASASAAAPNEAEPEKTTSAQVPDATDTSDNPEVVGQVAVPPEEEATPATEAAAASPPKPLLEVPPRSVRSEPNEDLALTDFVAAMEALLGIGGVATWMGLRGGSEYRSPLDTHLQVLPFPLHSQGEACPLRYPLELLCDAALRDGVDALKVFPFRHSFSPLAAEGMEDKKKQPKALGQAALEAYEAAKVKHGHEGGSCAIAFTTTWLVFLPLAPPDVGSAPHEAWLKMPPPRPRRSAASCSRRLWRRASRRPPAWKWGFTPASWCPREQRRRGFPKGRPSSRRPLARSGSRRSSWIAPRRSSAFGPSLDRREQPPPPLWRVAEGFSDN